MESLAGALCHGLQLGQYLLEILLDGNIYWDTRTACERELAREATLESFGWEWHRIWPMFRPGKRLSGKSLLIRRVTQNFGIAHSNVKFLYPQSRVYLCQLSPRTIGWFILSSVFRRKQEWRSNTAPLL